MTWTDLIRGEVSVAPEHVPDYVIVRSNGQPLYPLVNPIELSRGGGVIQVTLVLGHIRLGHIIRHI